MSQASAIVVTAAHAAAMRWVLPDAQARRVGLCGLCFADHLTIATAQELCGQVHPVTHAVIRALDKYIAGSAVSAEEDAFRKAWEHADCEEFDASIVPYLAAARYRQEQDMLAVLAASAEDLGRIDREIIAPRIDDYLRRHRITQVPPQWRLQ